MQQILNICTEQLHSNSKHLSDIRVGVVDVGQRRQSDAFVALHITDALACDLPWKLEMSRHCAISVSGQNVGQ